MMWRGILAAGLAAGAPLAQAEALKEPSAWLMTINEAARTSNYHGVVIYKDGEKLETMRITHRFNNGEERERMLSMTGEPREIVRDNNRVSVILPAARTVTVESEAPNGLFPIMSQDTVMALTNHYNFRSLGVARVAGRTCRGMHITPVDAYRYGYEICADEERRVPLRVSLIDNRGRILEQMMFTEVTFPATIPDSAFKPQFDTRGFTQVAEQARPSTQPATAWVMQKLPPGFRLKMRDVRQLPGAPGMVEHLLLSDGLSMVSVYSVVSQAPAPELQGHSSAGGVNAYGRVVGPFHVTVVGEVPEATVEMIGEGLVAPETDDE